jgi:hypothetical protein
LIQAFKIIKGEELMKQSIYLSASISLNALCFRWSGRETYKVRIYKLPKFPLDVEGVFK